MLPEKWFIRRDSKNWSRFNNLINQWIKRQTPKGAPTVINFSSACPTIAHCKMVGKRYSSDKPHKEYKEITLDQLEELLIGVKQENYEIY